MIIVPGDTSQFGIIAWMNAHPNHETHDESHRRWQMYLNMAKETDPDKTLKMCSGRR